MNKTYIGIDPGKSGAIACLSTDMPPEYIKNSETLYDLAEFLSSIEGDKMAMIEKVNAMPGQGVTSTFTFGESYGQLTGLLVALRIPFEVCRPAVWQKAMQCRSGGNKNITKAKAQSLFPDTKIIHANADAILLAEYCRRMKL